jgi:arylsulfatase A-like enzyme
MSLPFALEPGIVVDQRVMNIDTWPTLLDMVGLPPLVKPDGKSQVPVILASAGIGSVDEDPERPVFGQLDRRWGSPKVSDPIVSVTQGEWRIVWWPKSPEHSLLFDLAKDPAEKNNVFAATDPESQHLSELAKSYYEGGKSPWGVEPPEMELDELHLNQLRALGYVIK